MKTAFIFFFILLMYATTAKSQQTFNSLNVKDLASNRVIVTSTTQGSKPCPAMTETQRNAIASPLIGQCIYNSTSLKLNVYNGSLWKSAGGGIENWVTAFAYAIGDVVIESFKIYQANTAHTSSGAFVTDIANWNQLAYNVSDATGVLPLANGGTNKNITASNGSIPYSDADSFEMLAAGTSGQFLKSNGATAPSWADNTITAKAQNGTSQTLSEIQVPNNSLTQTDTNKHLFETGNSNILANPSFEHSTFSTAWTNSAGTFTQETSVLISGKASAKLVLAAQTMSLTQSSTLYAAQFADGVQGLAMVRVKSDIALSVCSIQAGTVSTTDCVTTATDSKWGLYKIPFILGATSNGISIASSGSVTGTVYIDDAFVGAVDLKQDVDASRIAGESYFAGTALCTGWTRTSTTVGAFATDADCPGPTIVRSSMGTWATTDSNLPRQTITNLPAGVYKATFQVLSFLTTNNSAGLAINDGTTTCEAVGAPSVATNFSGATVSCTFTYTTAGDRVFELYAASNSGTIQIDNSTVTPRISSKFNLEYFGSTSTYSSQCGANCVDTFSAKIDSSGNVTLENTNWINGACTYSAGVLACTLNSGIATAALNCECTPDYFGGSGARDCMGSSSGSSVITFTNSANGSVTNQGVTLMCQKSGADFTASRTIVGSFKNVVTTPAVTKPISFSVTFAGASKNLVCSGSPCTLYGNLGGIFTSVTRASAGRYTVNMTGLKSGSLYNCAMGTTAFSGASSGFETYQNSITGVTSFTINSDSTLGPQDAAVSLNCHGEIE